MNRARPKSFVIYTLKTFLGEAECWISCYPQQRWEYRINGDKVTLSKKGVTLTIPKMDFERQWRIIPE